MKVDIDCIFSYENAKQLLKNDDAMELFQYITHIQLLCKLYKDDRKAFDIACKIANYDGFINFLKRKHTYETLEIFYDEYCNNDDRSYYLIEDDIDDNDYLKDYGEKIKLPEEKELSPAERRAMLLKKKPNVKCNN